MTINNASLIIVEGDQLPDATTVEILAISLSSARVTQVPRMPGPEVGVMDTKNMAIKAMVVVMVVFIGKPVVLPMEWIPMSSRGI